MRVHYITLLPEVDAHNYREALNLVDSRQEIMDMCNEFRRVKDKLKVATQRKASLG